MKAPCLYPLEDGRRCLECATCQGQAVLPAPAAETRWATVHDDLATLRDYCAESMLERMAVSRMEAEVARLKRDNAHLVIDTDRNWRDARAMEAEVARLRDETAESKSGLVTRLTQRAEVAEAEVARLRDGLRQIAGKTPTSHRREIDQLRDAVKWRQGIARDLLADQDGAA